MDPEVQKDPEGSRRIPEGPRRTKKYPEGPRRTQKDAQGRRKTQKDPEGHNKAQYAKADWSSSFHCLKLFKLVCDELPTDCQKKVI